jgi:porin
MALRHCHIAENRVSFVILAIAVSLHGAALAQEPAAPTRNPTPTDKSVDSTSAAVPAHDDTLARPPEVTPDFGGDLWSRQKLTGNWGERRPSLAEKGVTIDSDLSQFYQGVAGGGLRQQFRYGDYFDMVLNVDGEKLGLMEGFFFKMRFEANFGDTVNEATGAFLPVALSLDLPKSNGAAAITDFLFIQAFSESFALFAGKLDTLDGDANAFASGRGKDQFLNTSFVFNPVTLNGIPYSALAAGFVLLKDREPYFTFAAMDATDHTTTSGFHRAFADGVTLNSELRVPVKLLGLPGHQMLGGTWSSKEFTALQEDLRFALPALNVPINPVRGSWNVYYNFDQYLVTDASHPQKGWGIFGRAGISDGNPNPLKYFLSGGVGGNSPLRGRANDTFGIGYYYTGKSSQLGPDIGPFFRDGQGFEAFYNVGVTRWFHLTPDLQVIRDTLAGVDASLVIGLRGKIDF